MKLPTDEYGMKLPRISPARIFTIGIALVICLVLIVACFSMFASSGQDEVMVIQYPTGSLHSFTSGGIHCQCFGKVTKYPKRMQFFFSSASDQGDKTDQSIKARFNDGGHGNISGGVSLDIPLDEPHLFELYKKFNSPEAIRQELIRPAVERAVYLSGPLMNSTESYAARRNELVHFIEDQVQNGVYQSSPVEVEQADPITNEKKTVSIVRLKIGPDGNILRQEDSPIRLLGLRAYNMTINDIKYEDRVEKQITQQQDAQMAVQLAIAKAKQAEQDAITAAKNGEARAAEAKWEQEAIKAKESTIAETRLAVAELDNKAAEQYKEAQIKRGEGDGAYKRAVMTADGGLEKKTQVWLESQKVWADAFARHQGPLVPSVVMGGQGAGNAAQMNGVAAFMDLMNVKNAHDLSLDMGNVGKTSSK